MTTPFEGRLLARLNALHQAGLTRIPPAVTERRGVEYKVNGRSVIGFCSNDYLGLANHPDLVVPHNPASGATASRLVCGDLPEHREIEIRLAQLADTQSAVLFPSGFQLNVGVLPALLEADDRVFSDELNHASLIDGLRLARPEITILPHTESPPATSPSTLHWWVTEALFSMDGDYSDPVAMKAHLAQGGALYLDEAHSFGLFEISGRPTGYAGRHQLRPTILVGTLGKSFGCAGAFVAASELACRWIRARARSFVFSTGPSPVMTSQIGQAIDLLCSSEGDLRRTRLWTNINHLARRLNTLPGSPIFRLIIGDNATSMSLSTALLERGWHVQAIRPPTVPRGTARLRITVTANHDPAQIDAFANDLLDLLATTQKS